MDSAQPVPPFDKSRPRHIGRSVPGEDEDVQGHVLPNGRTRPVVPEDEHDDRA